MASTTGLTGPPQHPPRNVRQEVAPKGGYSPINVARNVPKSIGNGAGFLLLGCACVMSYGLYRVGTFNVHRRELKREKRNIRLAIAPMLQAEEDARFVVKREQQNKREAEIMKNVPGWKVGENVYKTRSFMPPTGGEAPYRHD